jgi:hypothetical protein
MKNIIDNRIDVKYLNRIEKYLNKLQQKNKYDPLLLSFPISHNLEIVEIKENLQEQIKFVKSLHSSLANLKTFILNYF